MFHKKSGQKVDIKSSNVHQKIFWDKNQSVLSKVDFHP
jgi:hypothetical protein